ncbi:MAG: Gluconate transporter family protein [uncultured Caballeronia sp.]|nr:MAG: Gluconate transporter family protein [uncultured Caballeronia sp.]
MLPVILMLVGSWADPISTLKTLPNDLLRFVGTSDVQFLELWSIERIGSRVDPEGFAANVSHRSRRRRLSICRRCCWAGSSPH